MTLIPRGGPTGFTIFCDDIRQEVNGKYFFVGVYAHQMFVNVPFPVSLDKLCLYLTYMEGMNAERGDLTLKVYLPGDPADQPTVRVNLDLENFRPPEPIELPPEDYELPEPPEPMVIWRSPLILSPCVIKEPGYLRVRMECGDKTYKLGALEILPAPDGQEEVAAESS